MKANEPLATATNTLKEKLYVTISNALNKFWPVQNEILFDRLPAMTRHRGMTVLLSLAIRGLDY